MVIVVYKYRVKSLNGPLNKQARAVNFVWNFCNDTQKHALKWRKKWPTAFDLINLTAGSSKELNLHSATICAVCKKYGQSRSQRNRPYLRYRGFKSLGWVPFQGRDIRRQGDAFRFHGRTFRVFNSRPLPEGKIKDGSSFSRDRKGNWFLNLVIEIAEAQKRPAANDVGIDLGLKEFATLSTGEKIDNPRHYRSLEKKLGLAQRANKRRQVTNIYAKIANRRKDTLHKLSNRIVKEFDYVAVGNVNAKALAKTSMAKSVSDAGWSSFRFMLAYKSVREGATYEEVNEAFSTQTCSACGCISGPKGRAGLNKRSWTCSDCDTFHDRDINAAINLLLRSGHRAPVQGASA